MEECCTRLLRLVGVSVEGLIQLVKKGILMSN